MLLTFRPLSIDLDTSSLFDINDLFIRVCVSYDDAVKFKRMGIKVTERQDRDATIRIKMVLTDHSRGFGIFIDKKPANPMDLYYTKNLKLDAMTVILRGPIPTYNGETFFVPWLKILEARSVKKEDKNDQD